jgi:cytochrome c oxidase subunit 2
MLSAPSNIADVVNGPILFVTAVSVFFLVSITAVMVYFAIRYSRRRNPKATDVHGHTVLEIAWTVIPTLLAFAMFWYGWVGYEFMKSPPADAMQVNVTARMWSWSYEYENGAKSDVLNIPVDKPVRLNLKSLDVIHSFYVPAFRIKKDAIPGRYATTWFEATKVGEYHLFCSEYCGTGHSGMIGSVIVMEPTAFQAWLAGGPPPASPVEAGRKLFNDLACAACHQTESLARGPGLAGIFGRKTLLSTGETVIADENYLRESIMRPAEKVVAGYQPVMPTYQGQISESDMLNLIAYLRSLEADAAAPAPTREAGREKP